MTVNDYIRENYYINGLAGEEEDKEFQIIDSINNEFDLALEYEPGLFIRSYEIVSGFYTFQSYLVFPVQLDKYLTEKFAERFI